jgi:hypothetical protein
MRGLSRLLLLGGLVAFLVGLAWVGKGTGYFSELPEVIDPYRADYLTHGMMLAGAGVLAMAISLMF